MSDILGVTDFFGGIIGSAINDAEESHKRALYWQQEPRSGGSSWLSGTLGTSALADKDGYAAEAGRLNFGKDVHDRSYYDAIGKLQQQGRGGQIDYGQMLRQMQNGSLSPATAQMAQQIAAQQAALRGAAASTRGTYNPAVRQAAMRAASEAPMGAAADVAATRAAEREAAMYAYQQHADQMRGQDIEAQEAERRRLALERAASLGTVQEQQALLNLGLQKRQAEQAAATVYAGMM